MIMGVDLGKDKFQYSIIDKDFKEVKNGSLSFYDKEAIKELITKNKVEIIILEYTGIYTLLFYKIVEEIDRSIKVFYIHSNYSDLIRKHLYRNKKTDKLDALIIAKSWSFKEFLIELKVDSFTFKILELVRQHKMLRNHLRELKTLVKSDNLFPNNHIKETINFVESKKKEIEKEMKKLIKNSKYELLVKTIDGINYVSLAYILAYTKDIRRFPTVWKFLAYCGVAPITYSSGKFNINRTTSKVNKELKSIFRMAALSLIKKEPYKTTYQEKRKQGKHHYVALSHIAKRIAKKVYYKLNFVESLN